MAEQKSITQNYATPYKFTGKELDEETGLYYFGARYYAPRESIWLSTDPLAEKFPSYSPYNYCLNNPLNLVDPDGKWPIYSHYIMTKRALISAGVDRKTAREIAHYSSTYADHPSTLMLVINKVIGVFKGVNPKDLSYKKGVDYSDTEGSQGYDDENMQAIHGTKGVGEQITSAEATARTEANALETFEKYEGVDLSTLSIEGKKEVGKAFHGIQDTEAHKGATWAKDKKDNTHSISNDVFGDKKASQEKSNKVAKKYFETKKDE